MARILHPAFLLPHARKDQATCIAALVQLPGNGHAPDCLGHLDRLRDRRRYPAIKRQWEAAWEQVIPFFAFPPEVRKVIYTTDEIVKTAPAVDCLVARIAGFLHLRPSLPERRRGQDAVPHWTNDLDRAEHRHILTPEEPRATADVIG